MEPLSRTERAAAEAIATMIRNGVAVIQIERGQEPPPVMPDRAVILIQAGDDGPDAFKVDGVLDAAFAIYLVEQGHAIEVGTVTKAAHDGALVLIVAGASFGNWFRHVERLGFLPKTLAQGFADPRGPLQ